MNNDGDMTRGRSALNKSNGYNIIINVHVQAALSY